MSSRIPPQPLKNVPRPEGEDPAATVPTSAPSSSRSALPSVPKEDPDALKEDPEAILVTAERRLHRRVDLLAQVQMTRSSEVHIMSTVDISRGGVFVQGDPNDAPELTSGIDLDLVLFCADDPRHEIVVRATIVRVVSLEKATRELPGGFGLRFSLFAPGHYERLCQILDGTATD
ncbi:MAG: PilZ domain-containing protein [Deltaproteobacteria bacterium]|nr:PilZ domain-containing protein [Deltaproteobacteria bacterium]